jgi:hypothetical protein
VRLLSGGQAGGNNSLGVMMVAVDEKKEASHSHERLTSVSNPPAEPHAFVVRRSQLSSSLPSHCERHAATLDSPSARISLLGHIGLRRPHPGPRAHPRSSG